MTDHGRRRILAIIAGSTAFGLAFQAFHTLEHFVQVFAWIGGFRIRPYMTPWADWAARHIGMRVFPNETMMQQLMVGMEILHLIGNSIFLLSIAGLAVFVKRRALRWAAGFEAFHLLEHMTLTGSMLATGRAIGISTLYGLEADRFFLVTYRVWWHFIFGLIPTTLAFIVAYPLLRRAVATLRRRAPALAVSDVRSRDRA